MVTFPLTKNKTPAIPKGTNWQEYQGEVNTPMIGVMIPKGVFVIDVDLYKGITYEEINATIGFDLDWVTSLIQTTLNGGAHHAFSIPEDLQLINDKNVIINGLDTRSSGKGYIATGKGYTDKTEDGVIATFEMSDFILPELPEEVFELFKTKNNDECSDLATIVANSDTLELSTSEIKDYLDCLPESAADDDWLNVIMAVYHETQGSEEGYELVDEWSKQCPEKYDEVKNRRRWDSARNDSNPNPITFKTVIKLAGGKNATNGLEVKRIKEKIENTSTRSELDSMLPTIANLNISNIDLSMLTDLLQKKYGQIADIKISKPDLKKEIRKHKNVKVKKENYVDDYVFCTTSGLYVHRENLVAIGPRSFSTKHNRETPPNSEGTPQNATTYADNFIEIVDDTMYLPWADDRFTMEGVSYFNTFKQVEHEHVDVGESDVVERVLEHAEWLLPGEKEREILLSFIAHQIQNKGKLLQWALVLQGTQGDGKSFWAELITHLLGNNNVGIVSPTQFSSRFNAWAHGHIVNTVEELKVASGTSQYDVLNQVKPLITNPKITVEGKGVNSKEVVNCTNYFCTTNFKDAVPIDAHDRRWCVLFTQERDVQAFCDQNPDHFPDLYASMRENIAELYTFFSEYEIPKWFKNSVRAPQTVNKEQMIELSKSEAEILFEMAMEEFEGDYLNESKIDITYLNAKIEAVQDAGDHRFEEFPKTRTLRKILLSRGYSDISRETVNGKLHRIYRK